MSLTDIKVRSAKAQAKPYKLSDEKGLFLLITAAGSKGWRVKYRWQGKEQLLSCGVYPETSLAAARKARDDLREQLAAGINPSLSRKQAKLQASQAADDSFEAVAKEWMLKHSEEWTPIYAERMADRLAKDIFPWLGLRPISQIKAVELLMVLKRIESRGALVIAKRMRQSCGGIFRYAVATGRAERDIAVDLKDALKSGAEKHHASIIEPKAVGELLRAISGYTGEFITSCALRLAPMVFVRPGELRHAEWKEINLDAAEWRLPAEKMKARVPHVVPLSLQAVAILRELEPLTGRGKYVFPGVRSRQRPMSENTVLAALRRMGYPKEQMTGHGFRSMASTLLNEQGWNKDAIERQLAHGERNKVRAAYNYAEHLPERRRMMQAWADYLDKLRESRASAVRAA
ncbi:MAG: tyrosine-type recombinase/integrase [Stagnimonas sp.]|nr:tyrosine-type recombinase/integrase [Stagnimonas sp.]